MGIALDAVLSAGHPYHFLTVTKQGRSATAATAGNPDCHIIVWGGKVPNYDTQSVAATSAQIERSGRCAVLMIEASHENLGKQPVNQPKVLADIGAQVAGGDRRIIGAMIESNLVGERRTLVPGQPLVYGQSTTEGCIGWAMTEAVLELLAESVGQRRIAVEAAVERRSGGAWPADASVAGRASGSTSARRF